MLPRIGIVHIKNKTVFNLSGNKSKNFKIIVKNLKSLRREGKKTLAIDQYLN